MRYNMNAILHYYYYGEVAPIGPHRNHKDLDYGNFDGNIKSSQCNICR